MVQSGAVDLRERYSILLAEIERFAFTERRPSMTSSSGKGAGPRWWRHGPRGTRDVIAIQRRRHQRSFELLLRKPEQPMFRRQRLRGASEVTANGSVVD